jgi:hypothetical protein
MKNLPQADALLVGRAYRTAILPLLDDMAAVLQLRHRAHPGLTGADPNGTAALSKICTQLGLAFQRWQLWACRATLLWVLRRHEKRGRLGREQGADLARLLLQFAEPSPSAPVPLSSGAGFVVHPKELLASLPYVAVVPTAAKQCEQALLAAFRAHATVPASGTCDGEGLQLSGQRTDTEVGAQLNRQLLMAPCQPPSPGVVPTGATTLSSQVTAEAALQAAATAIPESVNAAPTCISGMAKAQGGAAQCERIGFFNTFPPSAALEVDEALTQAPRNAAAVLELSSPTPARRGRRTRAQWMQRAPLCLHA